MKKTFKIALLAALSVGSASLYAYKYVITITPTVIAGGDNLKYTKKVVLGGFEPSIFSVQTKVAVGLPFAKIYETAGICMWGSEFEMLGGTYAGEKIEIMHANTSPNVCSGRAFTLGTVQELAGKPNVTVGKKGLLAVQMANVTT